jgi:RNA polymerase sigma factor (sigma-70 family)
MTVAGEDPVGLDRLEIVERPSDETCAMPESTASTGASIPAGPGESSTLTPQRQLEEALRMDLQDAVLLVSRFAFRLCNGNSPDTKDLVQGVFLKLVKQIKDHRLLRVDNPQGFLFTVTRNQWIDDFRSIGNLKFSNFDELHDVNDASLDVEGTVINKLEVEKIVDIMDKLRPDLKEAVQLVVMEGMSRAEAARRLGVHPNTLAYRLKVAINEIRTIGRRGSGGQR